MRSTKPFRSLTLSIVTLFFIAIIAVAGTTLGTLTFTNTPLLRPNGSSEPEISIAANGRLAIASLSWLAFGTDLWMGSFGSTPTFEEVIDAGLQQPGRVVFGGEDTDLDLGASGALHVTTLLALVNPTFVRAQLGVSAITCPNAVAEFVAASCVSKIIDTTNSDRSWISSEGTTVYITYHDPFQATLIHAQRSDDDGLNWHRVGDPIVGQGRATADATFNNNNGPIVADSLTHNVYDIYAAGEPGIQKATSIDFNHIFVSRSTDAGVTWTANLVYTAAFGTDLENAFPALAVDRVTGKLYAVWSDAHHVFFSTSSNEGNTWSSAVVVNIAPAVTAVEPWVAALNGTVDVVYYGTTASSNDDPSAVWNVYMAQTTNNGASFTQSKASNTSNHTGPICTIGIGCASGTRNLLDLFQVAIDPLNLRAAIIYTDDTLTKDASGAPLPQVVLAQQK